MSQYEIVDDIPQLLEILPPHVKEMLRANEDLPNLIEVIMDLGRPAEARFPFRVVRMEKDVVTQGEIDYVLECVGTFGADNRAGIERTLHRISGIRNRQGKVVGLTCRVGRAVFGTLEMIRDVVEGDRSVLFLGRPGVGKTTMLREFARVLADDLAKRVVIVDTSNEIAGDGDIPHPAIGNARRMQVPIGVPQADVMIEAVENHMPEVIIIDEIGTQAEAEAARTIAERGVRLIGTAHGNSLDNLTLNPTLSDLVGGIQAVTLGDDEARKRGTQKTVLERMAPPTFDVLIEIQEKDRLAIFHDVGKAVDALLRGVMPKFQVRRRHEDGRVKVEEKQTADEPESPLKAFGRAEDAKRVEENGYPRAKASIIRLFPYAVSRNRLERAIRECRAPVHITKHLHEADVVLTLKGQYRKMPKKLRDAEERGLPIRVVRSNTLQQIQSFIQSLVDGAAHLSAMAGREQAAHPDVAGLQLVTFPEAKKET